MRSGGGDTSFVDHLHGERAPALLRSPRAPRRPLRGLPRASPGLILTTNSNGAGSSNCLDFCDGPARDPESRAASLQCGTLRRGKNGSPRKFRRFEHAARPARASGCKSTSATTGGRFGMERREGARAGAGGRHASAETNPRLPPKTLESNTARPQTIASCPRQNPHQRLHAEFPAGLKGLPDKVVSFRRSGWPLPCCGMWAMPVKKHDRPWSCIVRWAAPWCTARRPFIFRQADNRGKMRFVGVLFSFLDRARRPGISAQVVFFQPGKAAARK